MLVVIPIGHIEEELSKEKGRTHISTSHVNLNHKILAYKETPNSYHIAGLLFQLRYGDYGGELKPKIETLIETIKKAYTCYYQHHQKEQSKTLHDISMALNGAKSKDDISSHFKLIDTLLSPSLTLHKSSQPNTASIVKDENAVKRIPYEPTTFLCELVKNVVTLKKDSIQNAFLQRQSPETLKDLHRSYMKYTERNLVLAREQLLAYLSDKDKEIKRCLQSMNLLERPYPSAQSWSKYFVAETYRIPKLDTASNLDKKEAESRENFLRCSSTKSIKDLYDCYIRYVDPEATTIKQCKELVAYFQDQNKEADKQIITVLTSIIDYFSCSATDRFKKGWEIACQSNERGVELSKPDVDIFGALKDPSTAFVRSSTHKNTLNIPLPGGEAKRFENPISHIKDIFDYLLNKRGNVVKNRFLEKPSLDTLKDLYDYYICCKEPDSKKQCQHLLWRLSSSHNKELCEALVRYKHTI